MPCPLPHALASPCLLRCVSPSPSHRLSDGPSFFPPFVSPVGSGHRLALPFPCHLIEYAVRLRLLACRCRGWGRCLLISSSRHLVISSSRLVVRCRPAFPACLRLVSPVPSHLIIVVVSIVASIVSSPFFDTVGRGVGRGASVSCLLGSVLRSVPMSAGVDSRFVPFPSSAVSSLGLLALSARLRER